MLDFIDTKIMDPIRGLVYWMGFRPKLYTVLHSPTRHLKAIWSEAMRGIDFPVLVRPDDMLVIKNYKRLPQDCPNCNGWVLSEKQEWVRVRETVGLVCPACGTNYGEE